jgi:exopolysaccharide production protein ExoZ
LVEWLQQRFELARGGSTHNVRPMEGLRGFAVLLVFFVHYVDQIKQWLPQEGFAAAVASAMEHIGHSGVDLFFALSGYLIYGSLLSRAQPFLPYIARRIQRIYPVFTAVFVLYIGLSLLFPDENKIPSPVSAGAIYLMQNYLLLPGLLPIRPMISVAWSLSYEMFYYLAAPVLLAALGLRRRSSSWRVAAFIAIGVGLAAATAVLGGPARLIMFVCGIVLFEAIQHSRLTASSLAGVIALIAGLACMLLPIADPAGLTVKTVILSVAFFVVCLACFGTPQATLPRAFSWLPLRWLGNMSYSYYLAHGLALKGAFLALSTIMPPGGDQPAMFWLLLPPMLAVTLLASAPLFLWVERPFSLAPRRKRGAAKLPHAASASESGS